ncbi:MAG: hypothetical protein DRP89_03875, partial [Candidatus Neomarinimicrobiota bacterium]
MKNLLITSVLFLSIIFISCAPQLSNVTTEDVEKLRVDYNRGKIQTVEDLIAIYKDPIQPMETRIAALQALAQTQHPDAIKILHDFMYQSVGVNYALLTATANALMKSQRPEDITAMVNGVSSAQKKYINFRTTILKNIEGADINLQVEQLLNLYQTEKENYVQMQESLTRVLGSIKDERVIPILINIARDKSVKISVRSAALEILGKKQNPLITEAFVEMLGDPETQLQIRDFALKAIGDIKEARVILALLETYNAGKEEYFTLTETLTKALGDFSDPAVIPALTEIVKNPEFPLTTRKNALNALIKFKDPKIFDSLLPMMESPDNYVLFDEMSSMASAIGG